jgi:hypothetical protein
MSKGYLVLPSGPADLGGATSPLTQSRGRVEAAARDKERPRCHLDHPGGPILCEWPDCDCKTKWVRPVASAIETEGGAPSGLRAKPESAVGEAGTP